LGPCLTVIWYRLARLQIIYRSTTLDYGSSNRNNRYMDRVQHAYKIYAFRWIQVKRRHLFHSKLEYVFHDSIEELEEELAAEEESGA